jgi:hypothetical protein
MLITKAGAVPHLAFKPQQTNPVNKAREVSFGIRVPLKQLNRVLVVDEFDGYLTLYEKLLKKSFGSGLEIAKEKSAKGAWELLNNPQSTLPDLAIIPLTISKLESMEYASLDSWNTGISADGMWLIKEIQNQTVSRI